MSLGACCRSQGTGGQGSVLLGIFILEPGFMVGSCSSLGLHQGRDPAGAANLGLWNLVPPSSGHAILHPLQLGGADVGDF